MKGSKWPQLCFVQYINFFSRTSEFDLKERTQPILRVKSNKTCLRMSLPVLGVKIKQG